METQGIQVDAQALMDASNILKVRSCTQHNKNNNDWSTLICSHSLKKFNKLFVLSLQKRITKVEAEAHKVKFEVM